MDFSVTFVFHLLLLLFFLACIRMYGGSSHELQVFTEVQFCSNFKMPFLALIVTRTFCFDIPIEIEFGDSIMRFFSRTINKGIELIVEFGCVIVLECDKA